MAAAMNIESLIRTAIRVGAPAYNAGQIVRCEQVYEETARSLLGGRRDELKPDVQEALQNAIQQAERLKSSASIGNKDADGLAWAFRRAFDSQLEPGGAGTLPLIAKEAIIEVISKGAPAYNRGDVQGCKDMYVAAAEMVVALPDVPVAGREALKAALGVCQQSTDPDRCAWALRRAFNALLREGPAEGPAPLTTAPPAPLTTAPATRASPGKARALICNFATGEGLGVTGRVTNDTVMGGRSSSSLSYGAEGVVFEGEVTRRGGGGFVSVRFRPEDTKAFCGLLGSAEGVVLVTQRLRGCAAWKFQLNQSPAALASMFGMGYYATQWQAEFVTSGTESEVRIPFSRFMPTTFGKPTGARGIDRDTLQYVEGFGFMLSFLADDGSDSLAFEEGLVALRIVSVGVY